VKAEIEGIGYWRHELTGCLHVAMGVLLKHRGHDPLEVLGAHWGFYHDPADLRREEYYFPARRGSLLADLAPYHPVSSQWHAATAAEAWPRVRDTIASGQPVAVAADNYHLPFRPAFRDVHTNHLIVVYGFDDARAEALVADPVPPSYQGPVSYAELAAARGSDNPVRHGRDLFFTDNPIGNRWLTIETADAMPAFDQDFVAAAVGRNLADFGGTVSGTVGYAGTEGQRRFLDDIAAKLAAGDEAAVDEAFVVAGPMLAQTALHASWLSRAARDFADPGLAEAARRVERVAHHWSAVRIIVASSRARPASAAGQLRRRAAALADDHWRAIDDIARTAGAVRAANA
jgi:Butirosin biosynthesis protein H, N-terminal